MTLSGKLKYLEKCLSHYQFVLIKPHTAYSGIIVGFVVDRMALVQIFLRVLCLPPLLGRILASRYIEIAEVHLMVPRSFCVMHSEQDLVDVTELLMRLFQTPLTTAHCDAIIWRVVAE
jgi:hypothetical protein